MSKKIDDYTQLPHFERKNFPAFIKSFDDVQGIVEHIVAVMGNVDDGGDRIKNGGFTKSITEHGMRVKCLDQHSMDSVTRIVGKPIAMREIGPAEMPAEVLQRFPEATGGLLVKTQYAMDTSRGKDVYNLVKGGFAPEMSIGYDALDTEYVKEVDPQTGKERVVRELKTLRLWEYSNVVFGMNAATATLSAKKKPTEGKPYRAIEEGGVWRVYKLDEDGEPTGEPLGEHETEEEANAQVRALYANEGKSINLSEMVDSVRTAFGAQFNGSNGPWRYWASAIYDDHVIASYESDDGMEYYKIPYARDESGEITFADRIDWVEGVFEFIATPKSGRKAGRVLAARNAKRILDAMNLLHEALADAGLMDMHEEDDAPEKAAITEPETEKAGPDKPPTSNELVRLIEIDLEQLKLLEV